MAIKVANIKEHSEYILTIDRESAEPTKFYLRPLNSADRATFNKMTPLTQDQAIRISMIMAPVRAADRELTLEEAERINAIAPHDREQQEKHAAQYRFACVRGIVKVEGVVDLKGNPIEVTPAEFVDAADDNSLAELSAQICKISQIGSDTVKK